MKKYVKVILVVHSLLLAVAGVVATGEGADNNAWAEHDTAGAALDVARAALAIVPIVAILEWTDVIDLF